MVRVHCAIAMQDPARQDGLRQGVRWQLLDGGAVTSLTSLLHSTSQVLGLVLHIM